MLTQEIIGTECLIVFRDTLREYDCHKFQLIPGATELGESAVLNTQRNVLLSFDDEQLDWSIDSFSHGIVKPAMIQLALDIKEDCKHCEQIIFGELSADSKHTAHSYDNISLRFSRGLREVPIGRLDKETAAILDEMGIVSVNYPANMVEVLYAAGQRSHQ